MKTLLLPRYNSIPAHCVYSPASLSPPADYVTCVCVGQLSPFPFDLVKTELDRYGPDTDVLWAQEEAKNNGAWAYVEPRFETAAATPKVIR